MASQHAVPKQFAGPCSLTIGMSHVPSETGWRGSKVTDWWLRSHIAPYFIIEWSRAWSTTNDVTLTWHKKNCHYGKVSSGIFHWGYYTYARSNFHSLAKRREGEGKRKVGRIPGISVAFFKCLTHHHRETEHFLQAVDITTTSITEGTNLAVTSGSFLSAWIAVQLSPAKRTIKENKQCLYPWLILLHHHKQAKLTVW